MDVTKLATMAVGFLGSLAGAGPWGLAAMLLGIIASVAGVGMAINRWNKNVDENDQKLAGTDAGNTATELQNQTREVSKKLSEVGSANPAVEESEADKKKT